jgi:hypothetical protein
MGVKYCTTLQRQSRGVSKNSGTGFTCVVPQKECRNEMGGQDKLERKVTNLGTPAGWRLESRKGWVKYDD